MTTKIIEENPAVCAVCGLMGVGKTMTLVHIAYELYKKNHDIYSIISLNKMAYKKVKFDELNDVRGTRERPAVLLLPEIWKLADSRKYKSQKNEVLSQLFFYSRHRHVKIYYDAQNLHQVDKRIRDVTDACIIPELYDKREVIIGNERKIVPTKCIIRYYALKGVKVGNEFSRQPVRTDVYSTPYIMTLYDTNEDVCDEDD